MSSKKLLILNGLAIIAVPLHHAAAYGLQAMFYWTDRYRPVSVPNFDQINSISYYVTTAIRQLDAFSVPAFLFISGYFIAFMARGEKSEVTWSLVTARVKTLLPPFLIWTVIRYALLRDFPSSIDDVLDPYHFIPLLIQFYLLSPWLVPLAKKNWKLFLLGAAFFQFGVQGVRYLDGLGVHFPGQNLILFLTPRWFFIGQQPFWFPFGLVIGLHMAEFQQWLARAKRMLLPGTVAFGSLAILEFQAADNLNGDQILNPAFAGFTRTIYVLVFLLWFLSLNEKLIPLTNQIVKVSSKSLGIYMANIPAIYITAVLMYKFTPKLLGIQPVYQGILFTAGLFGPILLMELVRRSPARPWYRTLFG